MSRCEKKLKDKLDTEIKLAGLEALVPEELERHLILNSNRLRTFEDARPEVVTYVEAKFGLRIRDSKPSDTSIRGHSDPTDVDAVNTLLSGKGKGSSSPRVGCFLSAVEHIFNETAMHARAQASNRLANPNRASHGPRVRAKVRVKRTRGKSKRQPKGQFKGTKGAKRSYEGKTSKTGLSGLDNSKSETSSESQESAQTCTTDTPWYEGWNGDEWNDSWSFDDWSSVGWHEGCEQTYDSSASSFSLGSLDVGATSSPKRFEWVNMNLDTGDAVNIFPLNFGPEGAGGGRFYRTASGEWIPDCGSWQYQGYDENGLLRSLNGRLTCAQSVVQCCRDRVQTTTRFPPGTRRWLHDSDSQQNWSVNENSF